MKRILALLFAIAFVATADAGNVYNPQTDQSQLVTNKGQLPATATNDSATAGKVGEYVAAVCASAAAAGTVTVTIAAPAVVTFAAAPYLGSTANSTCPIVFTTSGALPTGIVSGTQYWSINSTLNGAATTFQIATSIANALAGTAITTTGSQSGTHTGTPGVVLTTATAKSYGAIQLTAGNWMLTGVSGYAGNGSTSVTQTVAGISSALDTIQTNVGKFTSVIKTAVLPANNSGDILSIPNYPISTASTIPYYGVSFSAFTLGTQSGFGAISAIRPR